jgi:hypothetical protein
VAKANTTLFIPERIRQLRPSNLPLPSELASVLRKLRISTLDDLSAVALHDFQRVSGNGRALFLELGRLIERARRGAFPIPMRRTSRLGSVLCHRRAEDNSTAPAQSRTHDKVVLELPEDETIFIPLDARGIPLAMFPASARLQHIFEFRHFRLAADLHGLTFSEFGRYRNCGRKTLDELRALVRTIQHSHQPADPAGPFDLVVQEAPRPVAADAFFVPENVRDFEVCFGGKVCVGWVMCMTFLLPNSWG